MKKCIFLASALLHVQMIFSQIIVGGTNGSPNKTSILLEFETGQNKGIVLPYTRTLPSSPAEGTILLDAENSATARVKYYNGSWIDLSGQDADITTALSTQPTSSQVSQQTSKGVIIGSSTSTANGVLILESNSKALVLPQVESTDNIADPAPGMIVFINKINAKRLAIFNGNKWSYWKP